MANLGLGRAKGPCPFEERAPRLDCDTAHEWALTDWWQKTTGTLSDSLARDNRTRPNTDDLGWIEDSDCDANVLGRFGRVCCHCCR